MLTNNIKNINHIFKKLQKTLLKKTLCILCMLSPENLLKNRLNERSLFILLNYLFVIIKKKKRVFFFFKDGYLFLLILKKKQNKMNPHETKQKNHKKYTKSI